MKRPRPLPHHLSTRTMTQIFIVSLILIHHLVVLLVVAQQQSIERTYYIDSNQSQQPKNNTCTDVNLPCQVFHQVITAANDELYSMFPIGNSSKLFKFQMKIMMKGSYECGQLFDFSEYTNTFELSWIGMDTNGFIYPGCEWLVNRQSVIERFHFVNGGVGRALSLDRKLEILSFDQCHSDMLVMSELNVKNLLINQSNFNNFGLKNAMVETFRVFESTISETKVRLSKTESIQIENSKLLNAILNIDFFGTVKINNCHWTASSLCAFNAGNVLNITEASSIPTIQIMIVFQVVLDGISIIDRVIGDISESYLSLIGSTEISIRNWNVTNNIFANLISIQKGKTVQVFNCTFNNNTGTILSIKDIYWDINTIVAPIVIDESKFISNRVLKDSSFVSIMTSEQTASMVRTCQFRNNMGGSPLFYNGNSLIVFNCFFSNNVAEFGGAIRIENSNSLTLSNSSFIGNEAKKGGAIYLLNLLSGIVTTDTYCQDNIAFQVGGCIYKSSISSSLNPNTKYRMIGQNRAYYYGNEIGSELVSQRIEFRGQDGQFRVAEGKSIQVYPGQPLDFKLFIYDQYNQSTSKLSSDSPLLVVSSVKNIILQKQDYQVGEGYIMLNNLQYLLVDKDFNSDHFELRFSITDLDVITSFVNVEVMKCPAGFSLVLGGGKYYYCQSIPFEIIIPSAVLGTISLTIIFSFTIFVIVYVMKKLFKLRKQEKAEKRIEDQFKNKHFVFGNGIENLPLLENSLNNETPERYIIPISDITIVKKIGEGASGVVYKGLWNKTDVAIKQFKTDTDDEEFEREALLMSSLRHPSIVSCYGISLSTESKYMIVSI